MGISAEAPVLFAKAAEMFIHELTMRAWIHTEDNKRRTLQRNDIAMAITKYDQFDFLIDIVPRDDIKPATKREETSVRMVPDQVSYYFQLAQQHQQALQNTNSPQASTTSQPPAPPQQQPPQQQQQQQQQQQLQVIRAQMMGGGGAQPIVIQTAPIQAQLPVSQNQGQTIQLQGGQQVYIQQE